MTEFVKQIEVDAQRVDAYLKNKQPIQLTLMSFDKSVHELVVPVLNQSGELMDPHLIKSVFGVFTFDAVRRPIQINGEVNEDTVSVVIPDIIRGYEGKFGIEVDLQLTDDRTLTLAQFEAQARISEIDAGAQGAQAYYFELFEDHLQQVAARKTAATQAMTDDVAAVEMAKAQAATEITAKADEIGELSIVQLKDEHDKLKARVEGIPDDDDFAGFDRRINLKADKTEVTASLTASKVYSDQLITDLVNGAPSTLDTIQELATAMLGNKGVLEALNSAITKKADKEYVETAIQNIGDIQRTWQGTLTEYQALESYDPLTVYYIISNYEVVVK